MTTAAHRTLTAALAVLSLVLAAALIISRHTPNQQLPPEVHTLTDTLILRNCVALNLVAIP